MGEGEGGGCRWVWLMGSFVGGGGNQVLLKCHFFQNQITQIQLKNTHTNTACKKGLFDQGCSKRCRCKGHKNCDMSTGACPSLLCAPGFHGNNCQQGCLSGVVAIIALLFCFVAIVVVSELELLIFVFCCCLCRCCCFFC